MKFKIGFTTEEEIKDAPVTCIQPQEESAAVKSLVRVIFSSTNTPFTYYNDSFNLKKGDMVYVEGRLEGHPGTVIDIEYNFKIKLSQYKRVISVVNTQVHGRFYMAGSHLVAFDPVALPKEQAITWFKAPDLDDEEEYVSNFGDESSFDLNNIGDFKVSGEIAKRGFDYYIENRIRYISIDGTKGYAIIEGRETYEVEFTYDNGRISRLICSCPCAYNCKHELAVLLKLREMLDLIEKNYSGEYSKSKYFAAICKVALFRFAIDGNETGSIVI